MIDNHPPVLKSKQIIKATVAAFILGSVIFITIVLPAEYGLDPVGTGKLLGLSNLYQPEVPAQQPAVQADYPLLKLDELGSDPNVPVPTEIYNPAPVKQYDERQDSVTIHVPAGKGLEYKMNVLKYGQVKYEWVTENGVLYFDFHGEPSQANPGEEEYYQSYTAAYSNNVIGTFLAPFEGRHGWYFKNKTDSEIVVNLRITGQYRLVGE
tara:strand:- start:955 stop:1581 length:627 start_codon:yes stop_codon:yes gene_type:complete